ncbi:MAG: 23S rRNA (guanosine(2251)-2'-O)-methyltransferase RlmB [Spirochaetia bacterium]
MIVTGLNAIEEMLKKGASTAVLYVSKKNRRISGLEELAKKKKVKLRRVSEDELDKIASGESHKGAALDVAQREAIKADNYEAVLTQFSDRPGVILFLDGITDPHNLGAILRSADQFGVDCVVLPERRSARQSPVVASVSSGASAHVLQCTVTNLSRAIDQAKEAGFWIYGADVDGEAVWSTDLKGKVGLVMGREGTGLHRLVKEKCDGIVTIPAFGHVDSFNVSVAAGILLYEVSRQACT